MNTISGSQAVIRTVKYAAEFTYLAGRHRVLWFLRFPPCGKLAYLIVNSTTPHCSVVSNLVNVLVNLITHRRIFLAF